MKRYDLSCEACGYAFSVFLTGSNLGACPKCSGTQLAEAGAARAATSSGPGARPAVVLAAAPKTAPVAPTPAKAKEDEC